MPGTKPFPVCAYVVDFRRLPSSQEISSDLCALCASLAILSSLSQHSCENPPISYIIEMEHFMAKVKVCAFGISLDGFSAGPNQSLENPLGVGGAGVFEWFFPTRTFQQMHGGEGGTTGADDNFAARSFENMGAWILGRNMFGPIRGPWPDDSWKGWWGDTPPYHVPTFVLTHHPRASLEMAGGTTFHFVTDGIHAALDRAFAAANGKDVRIGGGAATIRQYLRAGLIDELHLAASPVLLGSGESLFSGINMLELGFRRTEHLSTSNATHIILSKSS